MNGYQFRGLMSGPCTAIDYTNIVTLTVTPLVAAVNPPSATICLGSIQSLSITNANSPTSSSFSNNTPLPIPDATPAGVFSTIPVSGIPVGAVVTNISVTLNITHTWVGDLEIVLIAPNGEIMNLIGELDNGTGSNGSDNFTNTVISSTGTVPLSGAPAPRTGTFAADRLFGYGPSGAYQTRPNGMPWSLMTSILNGNWVLGLSDWYSVDVGTLQNWTITITYGTAASGIWTSSPAAPNTMFTDPGATVPYVAGTPASTIYVKPAVNTNYTVVVTTNVPCTSAPLTIPVNVTTPISNLTIPATQAVCVGSNTTITATANGGPITWQWQVSDNGGVTYTNISGATSATLTLNNVTQLMNNYQYRVIATASPCGTVTSASFTKLIVNPLPTVTLSASPTQVMPGVTTFVNASSTPAGASYAWTLNGVPITGATTSSVFADVDRMGSYKVTVTDVNGCVRTSSELVISAQDNPRLFIYPNPNNGQFQARLYSPSIYLYDVHVVNIYNAAGAICLTKTFPISSQYVRMDFNMSGYAAGVYVARVTHHFTGKTVSTRFVIQH
jgi:subtilisin-like proprotein convertase family protein